MGAADGASTGSAPARRDTSKHDHPIQAPNEWSIEQGMPGAISQILDQTGDDPDDHPAHDGVANEEYDTFAQEKEGWHGCVHFAYQILNTSKRVQNVIEPADVYLLKICLSRPAFYKYKDTSSGKIVLRREPSRTRYSWPTSFQILQTFSLVPFHPPIRCLKVKICSFLGRKIRASFGLNQILDYYPRCSLEDVAQSRWWPSDQSP
jgi:hypothetical protein